VKIRKPATIRNPCNDKTIEVTWNLPVRLDVLTYHAITYGHIRKLAGPILDAASVLATVKGEWYGQESIEPIFFEVEESFRIVTSKLFVEPVLSKRHEHEIDTEKATQAAEYILYLRYYADQLCISDVA
jgi:hypothetical protein